MINKSLTCGESLARAYWVLGCANECHTYAQNNGYWSHPRDSHQFSEPYGGCEIVESLAKKLDGNKRELASFIHSSDFILSDIEIYIGRVFRVIEEVHEHIILHKRGVFHRFDISLSCGVEKKHD